MGWIKYYVWDVYMYMWGYEEGYEIWLILKVYEICDVFEWKLWWCEGIIIVNEVIVNC